MSRELDSMNSLDGERKISIKQARLLFPWTPDVSTIRRYITRGIWCHIRSERIFLEGYREGWALVTSVEAVQRFQSSINERRVLSGAVSANPIKIGKN